MMQSWYAAQHAQQGISYFLTTVWRSRVKSDSRYWHHPSKRAKSSRRFSENNDGAPFPHHPHNDNQPQTADENHGERGIYISAGIGETASYAINPQKGEKSTRRIDRSTTTLKTPTKI
jgi:hypothetical protein